RAHLPADLARELVPRAVAGVGGVVGPGDAARHQLHEHGAEILGPGRRATLVVHHRQWRAGERALADRVHEVPAAATVEPGGAHDEVARVRGAHGLLTG